MSARAARGPLRGPASRWGALALVTALAACKPIPRPDVLDRARDAAATPQAGLARERAPQAFARAEKLRREAEALVTTDFAGAQLTGERALAAYTRAFELARLAQAELDADAATAALATIEAEGQGLDAEVSRLSREAEAAELKVRVVRDAVPTAISGKADAEREAARVSAVRALAVEARMLCGGAKLLLAGDAAGADPTSVKEARAELDRALAELVELDKLVAPLGTGSALAPIDRASRVRATCLAALTKVRRTQTRAQKGLGVSDALLASLSAASFGPSRDDRGVVVTLRAPFGGDKLTATAEKQLGELAKVARAHPRFPVLVVLHDGKPLAPKDRASADARAALARRALGDGVLKSGDEHTVVAGGDSPVADPKGPARGENARIEIVFVAPEIL